MYCRFCGKQIPDDSMFCGYCGKAISVTKEESKISNTINTAQPKMPNTASTTANHGTIPRTHKNKDLPLIIVSLILLVGLLAGIGFGVYYVNNKSSEPEIKPPKVTLTPRSVANGFKYITPDYECICPLSISVSGDGDYYVYLEYLGTPYYSTEQRHANEYGGSDDDIGVYIKANHTVELDVPIGRYKLYYACGDTWYGLKYKFGPETTYNKSDDILEFYTDGQYAQGVSLELWAQPNGNFDTDIIDEK